MAKTTYFDPKIFVASVIDAMKLGEVTAPTMMAMQREIEGLLSDRILGTVIDSMGEKELKMFNNMLEDHPELNEMDALMVLAPSIDGLKEKLERAINSLYGELVYDAEKIEQNLKIKTT